MSDNLPEFEKLRELAQNDPAQLERLRIQLCDQLIQSAPESMRRRLRGLQFQIDMERRRAKSPMAACIAISGMMHESFDKLRQAVNEVAGNAHPSVGRNLSEANGSVEAKVLPFQRA